MGADVDQAGSAAPAAKGDISVAAALAGARLAATGGFPLPARLAPAAGAPRPAGLAAARPRADPVQAAPPARQPVARRVKQARAAQDLRGGTSEPRQGIEHDVIDEQLAVGLPHGQCEAQPRKPPPRALPDPSRPGRGRGGPLLGKPAAALVAGYHVGVAGTHLDHVLAKAGAWAVAAAGRVVSIKSLGGRALVTCPPSRRRYPALWSRSPGR